MLRRRRGAILLALACLTLAGCGTPPWQEAAFASGEHPGAVSPQSPSPTPSAEPTAVPTPEPTPEVTPTPAPAPVPAVAAPIAPRPNDLGGGSTRRELTAGQLGVTIDYWSDLAMSEWTSGANKPVSLSVTAHPALVGTDVYLSRVSVTTSVTDAAGTPVASPPVYEDRASVEPGYVAGDPYSYATTFVLPPLDPAATHVVLTLSYDLLVSTGHSQEYMKTTAVDTLRIALASHEPAVASNAAASERAAVVESAAEVGAA